MTDYFASHGEEFIILAWSTHTRDIFSEMRKAAANAQMEDGTELPQAVRGMALRWFEAYPAIEEEFYSNGSYHYKGEQSHWHDEVKPATLFNSEAEAQAYADAHPLHSITFEDKSIGFGWRISERETEHREKYSMGSGYYLTEPGNHSNSSGWTIKKLALSYKDAPAKPESVPVGAWAIPSSIVKSSRKSNADNAPTAGPQEFTTRPGTKPGFTEIVFNAKPDEATRDELKAHGFRWSRYNGCWYGKTDSLPERYTAVSPDDDPDGSGPGKGTTVRTPDSQKPATESKSTATAATAANLRAMADRLTNQVNDKLADRLTNTPKRLAQAEHARLEGYRLQRTQKALYALADLHERGTVPPELQHIKTKKAVYGCMAEECENIPNGYHSYRVGTGKPRSDDKTTVALWNLLKEKRTEQDEQADALRMKINSLQFSNIPGYFPTPAHIVDKMIDYSGLDFSDPDDRPKVLEPSAASAAIADKLREKGADVDCCEINHTLREILELKGHNLIFDDFLKLNVFGLYDAVIMNPPFEKWQDIAHIKHALKFVKPGGTVVAICAGGPKQVEQLQPIADHWEELPPGTFKESGTGVSTVLATFSSLNIH
jgi:hypothetical protein